MPAVIFEMVRKCEIILNSVNTLIGNFTGILTPNGTSRMHT